jgi:tetratricopeptide (TPR) repeat protein
MFNTATFNPALFNARKSVLRAALKPMLLLSLSLLSQASFADQAEDIASLQTRWAQVKYLTPEAQQEQGFAQLLSQAEALGTAHSKEPAYLIWEGIIRSTYAGAKGGLGALGEVKKAKALFEQALALDPEAMAGSAYTSLGSLYYQVPGWPIGFGDDEKADELLQKGLQYNPDGIDSNFFYADYLLSEKHYAQALAAFEKAKRAPPRAGRESADQGRLREIDAKIAEIQRKL